MNNIKITQTINTISKGEEDILKIWYKIKNTELAKLDYVWIDESNKIYKEKIKKIELIINKINEQLEDVKELLEKNKK